MSKRSDINYYEADMEGEEMNVQLEGSKFSLFGSLTARKMPSNTPDGSSFFIGADDDDDDDDDGIDVASFTNKINSFSSLAMRYMHTRDTTPQVGFADMDDNDLVFDSATNSIIHSTDDLSLNTYDREGGIHYSLPEKDLSALAASSGTSKAVGLRKANSMPSLVGMVETEEFSDLSLSSEASSSFDAKVECDMDALNSPDSGTSPLGLIRSSSVPASLNRQAVKDHGEPAQPSTAPQAPTKDNQIAPYNKSRILSKFFGFQGEKNISTISESDEGSDSEESKQTSIPKANIEPGSITNIAKRFSAKTGGKLRDYSAKPVKVKNRDLNAWAPGGSF